MNGWKVKCYLYFYITKYAALLAGTGTKNHDVAWLEYMGLDK